MLSEEQIKQIFFTCENDDAEGLRADDVDIYEFAKKVEEFIGLESSERERAKALNDWQG